MNVLSNAFNNSNRKVSNKIYFNHKLITSEAYTFSIKSDPKIPKKPIFKTNRKYFISFQHISFVLVFFFFLLLSHIRPIVSCLFQLQSLDNIKNMTGKELLTLSILYRFITIERGSKTLSSLSSKFKIASQLKRTSRNQVFLSHT